MKKSWKIRKDLEGVSPVIATILMVAITVVLAAVLYVMVREFTRINPQDKPVLSWGPFDSGLEGPDNYTASWTVAGIDKSETQYSDYRVVVSMDNAPLTTSAQPLVANQAIAFGNTVRVIVHDLGGEGRMTAGDSFLVYGMPSGHAWQLSLLWVSDSSEVQHQSWVTV